MSGTKLISSIYHRIDFRAANRLLERWNKLGGFYFYLFLSLIANVKRLALPAATSLYFCQ
jgi:hypothetical protein